MSNDVKWVNNTLGKGAVRNFITAYLREYDNIYKSMEPDPPRRTVPGPYFNNFIDTCKQILLSNPRYYHYNKSGCKPMLGPNLIYSLLLKHIVHNARKYDKIEAVKIHSLLFWFEERGITQLVVVPLDKFAKEMFEYYSIRPVYRGQKDGSLGYCSLNGTPVETGGMEISNTRVNALLNKIHRIIPPANDMVPPVDDMASPADDDGGDDDDASVDDDDDDNDDDASVNVGGKRRTKTNKRKYRYSRHASRRHLSTKRHRLSTKRTTRRRPSTKRSSKRR